MDIAAQNLAKNIRQIRDDRNLSQEHLAKISKIPRFTSERGVMELAVTGERYKLKPGDVVVFRGDQRHAYANVGSSPAIGFSVVLIG
jgi:hypothetical protein